VSRHPRREEVCGLSIGKGEQWVDREKMLARARLTARHPADTVTRLRAIQRFDESAAFLPFCPAEAAARWSLTSERGPWRILRLESTLNALAVMRTAARSYPMPSDCVGRIGRDLAAGVGLVRYIRARHFRDGHGNLASPPTTLGASSGAGFSGFARKSVWPV